MHVLFLQCFGNQVYLFRWTQHNVFIHDLPFNPCLAPDTTALKPPKTLSPGSAMRTTSVKTRKITTHFILEKQNAAKNVAIADVSCRSSPIHLRDFALNEVKEKSLTFPQIERQSQKTVVKESKGNSCQMDRWISEPDCFVKHLCLYRSWDEFTLSLWFSNIVWVNTFCNASSVDGWQGGFNPNFYHHIKLACFSGSKSISIC